MKTWSLPKTFNHCSPGLTLIEVLVAVVIVGILVGVLLPMATRSTCGTPNGRTVSNMKQLHLATQQMALDSTTTGDTNIGWPGNIGGSFSNWAAQLTRENYLSSNDLRKLLSGHGNIVSLDNPLTTNNAALLVYAVREDSPGDAVFLSTANFVNSPSGGTYHPSTNLPKMQRSSCGGRTVLELS